MFNKTLEKAFTTNLPNSAARRLHQFGLQVLPNSANSELAKGLQY